MNEDIRERIGRQIADLRAQKRITQQELADAAGMTRSHLSRIESGKYAVSLDILDRIATALDTHIEIVNN